MSTERAELDMEIQDRGHLGPIVTVIIPSHDRFDNATRCIESVLANDYSSLEIVLVDDQSSDQSYLKLKARYPTVNVVRCDRERLLAGARNAGAMSSSGDWLFFVDDDNVVAKDAIRRLAETARCRPEIGIIGPCMLYLADPETIWFCGLRRGMLSGISRFPLKNTKVNEEMRHLVPTDDIPNALMVRRDVFMSLGGFDEENFPIHLDEADFVTRAKKAGYGAYVLTTARIWHDVPSVGNRPRIVTTWKSSKRAFYAARNRILFAKKHRSKLSFAMYVMVFLAPTAILEMAAAVLSVDSQPEWKRIVASLIRGNKEGLRSKPVTPDNP